MRLTVLSPHLDDAVLSCGQLLAGRPGSVVVTVCTAVPEEKRRVCTSYDRDCGFGTAGMALAARQQEDALACHYLGARPVHLPFVDQQYGDNFDPAEVAEALAGLLPPEAVLAGPVGLAHPDHLATADAMDRALALRPDVQGWVYEELPSRVLWPEEVPLRLGWWARRGYAPALGDLGGGELAAKQAALVAYRSQSWAWNPHTTLVPERFHRLWPAG